ncbi:uncharacterized protein LOC125178078 [Hyalella azteca]|uniref:Uncharacterized protein LOC125178078 n=1 Tax=Hyalella azteca TaxID=294128 RepID=A0A979FKB7_HYAAZ|nr:uncharacterized protein LOC125178078 [Hyalella azteca]
MRRRSAFAICVISVLTLFRGVFHNEPTILTNKEPRMHIKNVAGPYYKLRPSLNKCKEMFTITEASTKSKNMSELIHEIRKQKIDAERMTWTINPYRNLRTFLPSMIEKLYPTFNTSDTIKKYSGDTKKLTQRIQLTRSWLKQLSAGEKLELPKDAIKSIQLAMLHQQREYSYKLKSSGNRVEQLHGQLPYVPCRIKTQFSEGELKQCFRRAAEGRETPYTIVFMGDSKSRRLYDSFVTQTMALNYTLTSRGVARSLIEGLLHYDPEAPLAYAVPQDLQQLKLVHVYNRFYDTRLWEFASNRALKKLVSWCTGKEQPPDIIVLDYGDWVFVDVDGTKKVTLIESLDSVWTIHEVLLRLVLRLGNTTQVLFHVQHRHLLHSNPSKKYAYFTQSISSTNSDLLYRQLLYLWTKISSRQRNNRFPNSKKEYRAKDKVSKFIRNIMDVLHDEYIAKMDGISKLNLDIRQTEMRQKKIQKLRSFSSSITNSSTDETYAPTNTYKNEPWFWDTTLPLVKATEDECEELYQHDPVTASLLSQLLTLSPFRGVRHMVGVLTSLGVNPERIVDHLRRVSLDDDADEPKFNASLMNNKFSALFKFYSDDAFSISSEVNKYFEEFATTYSMPDLGCMDHNHPGQATEIVKVTQLLNLACNKHLHSPADYCCSGY